MFEGAAKTDAIGTEKKELAPLSEIPFKRSVSKHRQDATRTYSNVVDPNDVLVALTASQEKLDEKPKAARVSFAEFEEKQKSKVLFKEPSRDSDEVATINNGLPWQKKHEYRTVTPFFKKPNKAKAVSNENVSLNIAFRPIDLSRSTEDVNKEIVKPVPIFLSKSYQELPRNVEFKSFDRFQTQSSDDLLLSNIDGVRKPESKRHKLMRIRSTSSNSLNRYSDQLVYENFHYDIPEAPMTADVVMRRKAPLPLPRAGEEPNKRHSKTVTYILDKDRDEFVLEAPSKENIFDEVYEDVLMRNNVTRGSDSSLFNSLVDSRDDCKFQQIRLGIGDSHSVFNVGFFSRFNVLCHVQCVVIDIVIFLVTAIV